MWRFLAVFGLAVLLALPLSLGGALLLNLPSNRVIGEWPQPAGLDYRSYGPYSVYVLEGARGWATLGAPRRYCLLVARAGDATPNYGHMLAYTFHPASGMDVETHIRASATEWGPEGVTFVEASGHRLFIPREMFTGGR